MTHAQVTATFSEELHPRADDGQFGSGSGAAKKAPAAKKTTPRRRRTRRVIPKGQLGFDGQHGTGYGLLHGDPRVKALQAELNRLGLTDSRGRKLAIDGKLGPLTTQSIRAAQRRLGMKATGIIAEAFIARLKATKALPAAKKARKAVHAKFDPTQKRDPDGTWGDGIPGPGGAIKDALKLAGKIQLGDGETLAGTDALRTEDGSSLPMAWVRGPRGTKLRLGIGIPTDDEKSWRAADKGSTVVLDEAGAQRVAETTRQMREAGAAGEAKAKELDKRATQLEAKQRELIRRQYPTLSPEGAADLNDTDENIQAATSQIERLQAQNDKGFAELPQEAKDRWKAIDGEIEKLSAERHTITSRFWADGGKDFALLNGAKPIDRQIEDLYEEQAQLHGLREVGGRIPTGYVLFYKQRRDKIGRFQRELDSARRDREELTADSIPLSTADATELKATSAELERTYNERRALIDEPVTGEVPAEWGDVAYRVDISDGDGTASYQMGVRPPDADEDWYLGYGEESAEMSADELAELERKLTGQAPVSAAAKVTAAEMRGIELARPGKWNLASGPLTVTKQHLIDAARYANRASARPGYVKIGHNDPRFKPGDGEPALGWVHNVRYGEDERGPKLIGDIHGMPDWLAAAAPTAWPDRSIEGWADFTDPDDGEKYALVVDGLALLGVTPPGMSSIQSLRDLPQAVGVAAASGIRVIASMSSAPVAVEEGAGLMDPAITRTALGLAADAPDDEVASALLAAAAQLTGGAGPAQQPVQASLFGDEPKPAQSAMPALPKGVQVIASSKLDELNETIRALTVHMEQSKRKERDEVIATAVQAGKFTPAQRQDFVQMWDQAPEVTRALIDKLTPNSALAVMAAGYAGGVAMEEDDLDREIAHLSDPNRKAASRG